MRTANLEGVRIDHPIIGGTMERESDRAPVAYAGVNLIINKHWVFYIKDDNLRRTMWLMRLMRISLRMVRNSGIELYALRLRFDRAPEFLSRLICQDARRSTESADIILYEHLMTSRKDMPIKTWRMDPDEGCWL